MTVAINVSGPTPPMDRATFDRLLVELLPQLARFACRLVGDTIEAGDLVQETCRRAMEAHQQFRSGTNALAWLCGILRNILRDSRRRTRREVSIEAFTPEAQTPEPIALWRCVSDEDFRSAVAALPDTYQNTYRRHVIDGQAYTEIARDLGVAPGTVGVRLLRARRKVQGFLKRRLQIAPSTDRSRSRTRAKESKDVRTKRRAVNL